MICDRHKKNSPDSELQNCMHVETRNCRDIDIKHFLLHFQIACNFDNVVVQSMHIALVNKEKMHQTYHNISSS